MRRGCQNKTSDLSNPTHGTAYFVCREDVAINSKIKDQYSSNYYKPTSLNMQSQCVVQGIVCILHMGSFVRQCYLCTFCVTIQPQIPEGSEQICFFIHSDNCTAVMDQHAFHEFFNVPILFSRRKHTNHRKSV